MKFPQKSQKFVTPFFFRAQSFVSFPRQWEQKVVYMTAENPKSFKSLAKLYKKEFRKSQNQTVDEQQHSYNLIREHPCGAGPQG